MVALPPPASPPAKLIDDKRFLAPRSNVYPLLITNLIVSSDVLLPLVLAFECKPVSPSSRAFTKSPELEITSSSHVTSMGNVAGR